MKHRMFTPLLGAALFAFAPGLLRAWNYEGHRMVNQVALASLPADFPAWARTPANAERIAFLAGEPDRWRNSHEELLQHANGVDHYLDLEQINDAGLDVAKLSPFRYEFAAAFAAGRAAHADRFPPTDADKDLDHSRAWPGFLPWAIAEYYAKIQSAFSYLKALEQSGSPEEVANARANLIYMMGVMGHYVGDGSQPLHVTVHHHGWVGANPEGYTTEYGIHSWIDGGFIAKAGITPDELRPLVKPAQSLDVAMPADGRDPIFVQVMAYLHGTEALIVPLYKLEKAGPLKLHGPVTAEGRAFIDAQLVRGGEMLGSLWLTAWRHSAPDQFLQSRLEQRSVPPGPMAP